MQRKRPYSKRSLKAPLEVYQKRLEMIEELLEPEEERGTRLCEELKCYVIRGHVYGILYVRDRFSKDSIKKHFNTSWEPMVIKGFDAQYSGRHIDAPKCLADIVRWAERLGSIWADTFLRVDFFATNKGAVFGEFTFNPGGGAGFCEEADRAMGQLLFG